MQLNKQTVYVPVAQDTGLYVVNSDESQPIFSDNVKKEELYIPTPEELLELMKKIAEKAFDECEKWKGWVTSIELEQKKESYLNSLSIE